MVIVNRIAHILHNIVVQCSGSANKNIGMFSVCMYVCVCVYIYICVCVCVRLSINLLIMDNLTSSRTHSILCYVYVCMHA